MSVSLPPPSRQSVSKHLVQALLFWCWQSILCLSYPNESGSDIFFVSHHGASIGGSLVGVFLRVCLFTIFFHIEFPAFISVFDKLKVCAYVCIGPWTVSNAWVTPQMSCCKVGSISPGRASPFSLLLRAIGHLTSDLPRLATKRDSSAPSWRRHVFRNAL